MRLKMQVGNSRDVQATWTVKKGRSGMAIPNQDLMALVWIWSSFWSWLSHIYYALKINIWTNKFMNKLENEREFVNKQIFCIYCLIITNRCPIIYLYFCKVVKKFHAEKMFVFVSLWIQLYTIMYILFTHWKIRRANWTLQQSANCILNNIELYII